MTAEDKKGFSLIELLVVMAIMGGLIALVGPSLVSRIDKVKVQSDARKLQLLLDKLSNQAFLSGRAISIELEAANARYGFVVGQGARRDLAFEHIQFPQQQLTVNAKGFIDAPVVNYQASEQQYVLDLSKFSKL